MPPPVANQIGKKPSVTNPAPQGNSLKGTSLTATDTWNKPDNNLLNNSSSAKSYNQGIQFNKVATPPQSTGLKGSVSRPIPQASVKKQTLTFQGSKLRPLLANQESRPIVKAKQDKQAVKSSEPIKLATPEATVESTRSESVSSISNAKPVLPSISSKPASPSVTPSKDPVNVSESSQNNAGSGEKAANENHPTATHARMQSAAKSRAMSAAKLRSDAVKELKEMNETGNDYKPDWYLNPLSKMEPMKGATVVFSSVSEVIPTSNLTKHEEIVFYPLRAMVFLTDIKQFMEDCLKKSVLCLTYFPAEVGDGEKKLRDICVPPILLKAHAEKVNDIARQKGSEFQLYTANRENPEIFHLGTEGKALFLAQNGHRDEFIDEINAISDFEGYCLEIAAQLGIKAANSLSDIESLMNKTLKRKQNISKQEKAQYSSFYLNPLEAEDVWNHLYLCQSLSNDCYHRSHVIENVMKLVQQKLSRNGSPIVITGEKSSGKSWLCAQLPALLNNTACTIVRFCGLTKLSSSLPSVLHSISKQVHASFNVKPLPTSVMNTTVENMAMLFTEMLVEVSSIGSKPLAVVIDGADRLASSMADVAQFMKCCQSRVPSNTCLVFTLATDKDKFKDQQEEDLYYRALLKEIVEKNDDAFAPLFVPIDGSKTFDLNNWDGVISELQNGKNDNEEPLVQDQTSLADLKKLVDEAKAMMANFREEAKNSVLNLLEDGYIEKCRKLADILMDLNARVAQLKLNAPEGSSPVKDFDSLMVKCTTDISQRNELLKDIQIFTDQEEKLCKECISQQDYLYRLYFDNNGDSSQYELPEFSIDERRDFISHLARGKLDQAELEQLQELSSLFSSPLLLRLFVNRCLLGLPAEFMVRALKLLFNVPDQVLEMFESRELYQSYVVIPKILFNPFILPEKAASVLNLESLESVDQIAAIFQENPIGKDLKVFPLKFTYSERSILNSDSMGSDHNAILQHFSRMVMAGCTFDVYEQSDYVLDVEMRELQISNPIRNLKELAYISSTKTDIPKLVSYIIRLLHKGLSLQGQLGGFVDKQSELEQYLKEMVGCTEIGMKHVIKEPRRNTDETISFGELLDSYIKFAFSLQSSQLPPHEADLWEEEKVKVMINSQQNSEQVDPDQNKTEPETIGQESKESSEEKQEGEGQTSEAPKKTKAPVTSSKEKGYPQGRWRLSVLEVMETFVVVHKTKNMISDEDQKFEVLQSMEAVIEIILQYDFFVPLLHDYGVDYVLYTYNSILGSINYISRLHSVIVSNRITLELLCYLLSSYTAQLREHPSNFYTLFLTVFSADTCLTSTASRRLYNRVMHEVDIRNKPHLITLLFDSENTSMLSSDTKRYLQRTSDKYAAKQCLSNFYFILSHNGDNQVKLWELTGEFISAQKLDGRIINVRAQREQKCFLAVVEKVSEVGQRYASVWLIDRLTNKKVADLGTRTILSAWFDRSGEQIVAVEQVNIDSIRIFVSRPQSMKLKLDEQALKVDPFKDSSFMDRSRLLPQVINDELYDLMKAQFTSDKKDDKKDELIPELTYYYKIQDGYELGPAINSDLLVLSSLESLWDDVLEKLDAKEDFIYPMKETASEAIDIDEHISKISVKLHGMTSKGIIVVECVKGDFSRRVLLYIFDGQSIVRQQALEMDKNAMMTLMPTDDFVYCDTSDHPGVSVWNLDRENSKRRFEEKKEQVTCLQFEYDEKQILVFTRGHVTVWDEKLTSTESSFVLDKKSDVVSACLQDNWLAIANNEGELVLRFEIRKLMGSYHFHQPIDWIDCHVIDDCLYVACHLNGEKPSICFLKYKVTEAPLYAPNKYVRQA